MDKWLIVDDDELSCMMLGNFLKKYARCDTARDGRQALEFFEHSVAVASPYRLICVDLAMPLMNGHALVRKIRELEKIHDLARTKLFVISSSSSPWDMADTVLENISDDYVVKPFRAAELAALLKKHGLIES